MTPAGSRESTQQEYQQRILCVLTHLQQHLDTPLRLDSLAELAGYSPCHFHRIFTGMVGETVADHVRRLRLERSAHALADPLRSVLRIALDAGYQDHSAFARAFRGRFGCTPSAWRRGPRPLPPLTDVRRHLSEDRSGRNPDTGIGDRNGSAADDTALHPGIPTMDIEIRELDPLRVAYVRHIGPYQECGPAWTKLIAWAQPRGMLAGDPICLGVGHDDPAVTEPSRIRYDACIVVPDGLAVDGGMGVQVLPGGEHAVTVHRGPYEQLPEVYIDIMGRWLPRMGRRVGRGSPYEIYRNDVRVTAPQDLVTEVRVPLE